MALPCFLMTATMRDRADHPRVWRLYLGTMLYRSNVADRNVWSEDFFSIRG
jgi:hypothetical protein